LRENKSNEESYKNWRLDNEANSLGNAPRNWLRCRFLLVTKQLQLERFVLYLTSMSRVAT